MKLHRRKFLKQSTLAAAGSFILPRALSRLAAADAPAAGTPAAPAAMTTTAAASAAPSTHTLDFIPPAPAPIAAPAGFGVMPGPFQPNWESLANYQAPEWFRDAKFGIWAHWGPQCVPEQGDWYARRMYMSRDPGPRANGRTDADYTYHVQHYGHPSQFGFKDIDNLWHAEKWDPANLIALYKRAGAKFFCAMANHHDNLDMWDSKYQPWNTVNVGPKQDIIGGWAKAARAAGLKFAVSSHASHAWSWYEVSQFADRDGAFAGVPYDGKLTKADGKGQWWEGLDPQDLYAQYHKPGDGNVQWEWDATRGSTVPDQAYCEKFFNRTIDLIDKYDPDLLYFDDTILPLYPISDIGLRIAAYYYNRSIREHGGKLEAVLTGKKLDAEQQKCMVLDVERGVTQGIQANPWQTDTCIGEWHYRRSIFDRHTYKTPSSVAQMLLDIVSKNGCLQLNIPLPGNGLPDADEMKFLADFTKWMDVNSVGIYASRPWKVYGEGPSVASAPAGQFGGVRDVRPYTAEDFRFMQKGDVLYAYGMGWPETGKFVIKSLAEGAATAPGKVERVELLGMSEPLKFIRDADGLTVMLPETKVGDYAYGLKISGSGLI